MGVRFTMNKDSCGLYSAFSKECLVEYHDGETPS